MKLATVVRARPRFAKAAPVSHAIDRHPGVQERVIHTGQPNDHQLSELLFAPTSMAVENLSHEGIGHGPQKVIQTGDVMLDAPLLIRRHAMPPRNVPSDEGGFVVATIHRAENTDDPDRLAAIMGALHAWGAGP